MDVQIKPSRLRIQSLGALQCIVVFSIVALGLRFNHRALSADEPSLGSQSPAEAEQPEPKVESFSPSEEVVATLLPLFKSIADADVSRVKVELAVETVMHGEILSREQSTFQIAAKFPDHYTIYQKSENESKRIYSDGKTGTVALSPQAYYELPDVRNNQSLVTSAPVDLGPYPEPMLALSIAGADPSITFFGGMQSVDALGKTKFRGSIASVHVRGRQDDGVVWDLWISDEAQPRPLRLLVNLTPMLQANDQVHVPDGYGLSLRYDFISWRVTGEIDDNLFHFAASENAVKYESLADYQEQTTSEPNSHPLLGKPAPAYTLTLLDGSKVSSKELEGKIVVIDFWATWCIPCIQAMPTIKAAVNEYADKDVVFFAVNSVENPSLVAGFAGEQDWGDNVAVDPSGTLSDAFSAQEIPLTFVIGRSGIVESTHMGFAGQEALKKQFHDELDVLVRGGRIASSEAQNE